ncbi:MAG: hypothetical protein IT369_13480 [Candidatus Latescibacteria bacterium]|nr:hypothetical protein [Candidatus Latescibacterota bacterium]
MKKLIAALTAASYLFSFTVCLCYSLATGDLHASVPVFAGPAAMPHPHAETTCRDGVRDGCDPAESHHHSDASETCCVAFSAKASGIEVVSYAGPSPGDYSPLHLPLVSGFAQSLGRPMPRHRNHSPPGLIAPDPSHSPVGSRAPPLC